MSKKTTNSEFPNKYYNRTISENEEELLNQIWDSIDDTFETYNEEELESGFQEVKNRINKRKKVFWIYITSIGAVAAVALLFFLYPYSSATQDPSIHAQLSDL